MPRYQYYCENCDDNKTVLHPTGEVPNQCPDCRWNTLKRVFSFQILEKREKTKEEDLLESNKRKFQKVKDKVKSRTYEDVKNG